MRQVVSADEKAWDGNTAAGGSAAAAEWHLSRRD
jgi:hypothetical protein